MFDIAVTNEVVDRIAEIGRRTLPAKPAAYDSPEGVLFRKALALIADERDWFCGLVDGAIGDAPKGSRCSLIALNDAKGSGHSFVVARAALQRHLDGDSIIHFNATHTHAEVIAKWHEAGHANGWL